MGTWMLIALMVLVPGLGWSADASSSMPNGRYALSETGTFVLDTRSGKLWAIRHAEHDNNVFALVPIRYLNAELPDLEAFKSDKSFFTMLKDKKIQFSSEPE